MESRPVDPIWLLFVPMTTPLQHQTKRSVADAWKCVKSPEEQFLQEAKVALRLLLVSRTSCTVPNSYSVKELLMISLGTILLIVLLLLLIGAMPAWPYSRDWGYYPTGGLGLILLIVILLIVLGRL